MFDSNPVQEALLNEEVSRSENANVFLPGLNVERMQLPIEGLSGHKAQGPLVLDGREQWRYAIR
jgi:hypothetical protein